VRTAFIDRPRSRECLWLAAGICLVLLSSCSGRVERSAYQAELDQIAQDIRSAENGSIDSISEGEKAGKIAYLSFRRASLTRHDADFKTVERAIDHALELPGPTEDLYLLKAKLDFSRHRFSQAKEDLEKVPEAMGNVMFETIKADLAFQQGKYDDARTSYETLVRRDTAWDSFARLAYSRFVVGDLAAADKLYVGAQDRITAKEMGSYAWVELQRGFLQFSRGQFKEALAHYQRADLAYSGSWLVDDYVAEALGAEGRFKEAEARYRKLVAHSPRPEFFQALGDLYLFMGEAEPASEWHEKALAGYHESVSHGDVHYFHHLSQFYADVRQEGAEAVRWARKDSELRDNFLTQDSLGWALYRDGQFAEALVAIDRALSSKVEDAQIFIHAAVINLANGRTENAKELFRRAAELNPSYGSFHVHR
jgi:tetratricopeptide (TPR) repeat protein